MRDQYVRSTDQYHERRTIFSSTVLVAGKARAALNQLNTEKGVMIGEHCASVKPN